VPQGGPDSGSCTGRPRTPGSRADDRTGRRSSRG